MCIRRIDFTKTFKFLDHQHTHGNMKKIGKQKLIKEIQSCYDKHGEINRKIFNNDSEFSSGKTVYNYFGSFSKGCKEANVPHNNKPQEKDKVSVNCSSCGEGIKVYPYRIKENKNNRFFCDNKCQGDWWSDNLTGEDHPLHIDGDYSDRFGSKWHIKREKCLKRDSFECKVCGLSYDNHIEKFGKGLEVHHIKPRRKFYKDEKLSIDEANKMSNLVTLCKKHHVQVENNIIEVESQCH